MFKVDAYDNIKINEGDFGVILPITVAGLKDGENVRFVIKKRDENEEVILTKDFQVESSKINFQLTKEETKKLLEGNYLYDALQYKEDVLKNTICVDKKFNVEEGV